MCRDKDWATNGGGGSNSYVEIYKDIHLKSFSKKHLVKNAVTYVEASRVGLIQVCSNHDPRG